MKKTLIIPLFAFLLVFTTSCDEDTVKYADQLKAQEKLIKEFINREGITVLTAFPADSVFQSNLSSPSSVFVV